MQFTRSELTNIASAIWLQMNNPHIPHDCLHWRELDILYTKLIKEIDHAENTKRKC